MKNIYGENVANVYKHIETTIFDKERNSDILSFELETKRIIFKEGDKIYPTGKVVRENICTITSEYDYTKDENGNILECKVTKHNAHNNKQVFGSNTIVKTYDENGHVKKVEVFSPDGILVNRQQFWYNENGKLITSKLTENSTNQVITSKYDNNGNLLLQYSKTYPLKALHKMYYVKRDKNGRIIEMLHDNLIDYIKYDLDTDGDVISKETTVKNLDGKITSKECICYNKNGDITLVYENNILTKRCYYDLDGELIKEEKWDTHDYNIKNINKTHDSENNQTIIKTETEEYVKDKKTHYITSEKIIDDKNNIISYSKFVVDLVNNKACSHITLYEYDELNRKIHEIHKHTKGDGTVVTDEDIVYEYPTKDTIKKTALSYSDTNEIKSKATYDEIIETDEKTIKKIKNYECIKYDIK